MRFSSFLSALTLASLVCFSGHRAFGDSPEFINVVGSNLEQPKEGAGSNIIGCEGLGRAILYSCFYERTFVDGKFALGAGFSYLGSSGAVLPIYLNIHNNQERSHGYFTFGFLSSDPNKLFSRTDKNESLYNYGLPMGGVGWEYKPNGGDVILRASGYVFIFASAHAAFVLPWVGASVATTFN